MHVSLPLTDDQPLMRYLSHDKLLRILDPQPALGAWSFLDPPPNGKKCVASIVSPFSPTIRNPSFGSSWDKRNFRNLGGMRWLRMARFVGYTANSIQELPWPRRPGEQA
jgi:hypothetical protein